MKFFLVTVLLIVLYLRRPVKLYRENLKIAELRKFYFSFDQSKTEDEKMKNFQEIARRKALSNELIGGGIFTESPSPSYRDINDPRKIANAYYSLLEKFDSNVHWMKKYFNPKYLFEDIFFLPASFLGFLFKHSFEKVTSFFLSSIAWITTTLISIYSPEIRLLIDSWIENFIS